MTPTICAIDPGNEGAIAVLDGDSVILEPMPQDARGRPDLVELKRLLTHYVPRATRVYLELAGVRPGEAPQRVAVQWRNFGRIEGILTAFGTPVVTIRGDQWGPAYEHGVTETDRKKRYKAIKKARREIASRLYPGIDLRKNAQCEVPHEGLVDALLIADWGMKQTQGEGSQHEQEAEDTEGHEGHQGVPV